jgi:hypothetical protein
MAHPFREFYLASLKKSNFPRREVIDQNNDDFLVVAYRLDGVI